MKYRKFFLILLLGIPNVTDAQGPPPKEYKADAAFLRQYAETNGFLRGRPSKFQFTDDGKALLFLRSGAAEAPLILHSLELNTGKIDELLNAKQLIGDRTENLTPEEKARRERLRLTAKGIADYFQIPNSTKLLVPLSGRLYTFDRNGGEIRELKTGPNPIDPVPSPDGSKVAYVLDQDVYSYDLKAEKESRITHGGTPVKTHGLAEFVAQEEMGRMHGYWWSPDGTQMLVEEADHAGVEQWTVGDPAHPERPGLPQYYPRPGKKNAAVRLGLVTLADGIAGKEPKWLEFAFLPTRPTRQPYPKGPGGPVLWEYLARVLWAKDNPPIALWQDRRQQVQAFFKIDTSTGTTDPITVESDRAFLNLPPDLPREIHGGKEFISTSGLEHPDILGVLDSQSGKLRGVFADSKNPGEPFKGGPCVPESLVAVGSDSRTAIFSGIPRGTPPLDFNPTDRQLYQVELLDIRRGIWKPQPLTSEPGLHSAVYSKNLTWSVRIYTSIRNMPRAHLYRDGERVADIPSVGAEPAFAINCEMSAITVGVADADVATAVKDGPLQNRSFSYGIIRPRNFDPKKKYPVLVNVYGGPRHQTVTNAMRPWLLSQWLADQGFVVLGIDNRGAPARGRDWERSIYGKFGTVPLDDQEGAVRELAWKYPELNSLRAGIFGWSFGGYMSARAMMKGTRIYDFFKAGVAGAPVTDWEDYDSHYTERYMGLPSENAEGYREANLLSRVKDLHGPLLVIHGTADDNVYFRHSLRLADAAFRLGPDHFNAMFPAEPSLDLIPLAGVTHMYTADAEATEQLWLRTAKFFKKHLGEPK